MDLPEFWLKIAEQGVKNSIANADARKRSVDEETLKPVHLALRSSRVLGD
jgi:hypothetical protein